MRVPGAGVPPPGSRLTALRLIGSRLARPGAGPLESRVRSVVALADPGAAVHAVPARARQPWVDTGIELAAGDAVTVLASGTLWAARPLGIGLEPKVGLWLRVGRGPARRMLGTGTTLTSDDGGRLTAMAVEPAAFTEDGEIDPDVERLFLTGGYEVVAVRWSGDPAAGLGAAAATDPDLFAPALRRLADGDRTPPGWHHHPRIGRTEIFAEHAGAGTGIDGLTRADVGILRFPVDLDLDEDLTMSWSWRLDELPSGLPEDTELTHDYLSVAVELDDGRDLSWIWSSSLPVGKVFGCPLVYWRDRETHLVVGSGTDRLGTWLEEHRTVRADVAASLAPPLPRRVVAVWLIANAAIQGGTGRYAVRDLRFARGDDG